MKINLHSHTSRCGHACGTDEEYVLASLSQNFDVLGMSDHIPWPYTSSYRNPKVRMDITALPDYIRSADALKEKYAGKIRILKGFEVEYFPQYTGWLQDMVHELKLDFVILGNHYDLSDETGMYFGYIHTAKELRRYVDDTIRGLEMGIFSYLAHPDLYLRDGFPFNEDARKAAYDLCAACKQMNIPMEFNLHERYIYYKTRRISYPNLEFFEIARDEGIPVLIGIDAHDPDEIANPDQWDRAVREIRELGLQLPEIKLLNGETIALNK